MADLKQIEKMTNKMMKTRDRLCQFMYINVHHILKAHEMKGLKLVVAANLLIHRMLKPTVEAKELRLLSTWMEIEIEITIISVILPLNRTTTINKNIKTILTKKMNKKSKMKTIKTLTGNMIMRWTMKIKMKSERTKDQIKRIKRKSKEEVVLSVIFRKNIVETKII